MRRLTLIGCALLWSGCGIITVAPKVASCDFRPTEPTGTLRCQEISDNDPTRQDTTVLAFKAGCSVGGSVYAESQCPRAGIVAGCVAGNSDQAGVLSVDWFYDNPNGAGVLDRLSSPDDVKTKICDKKNPPTALKKP